MHPNKVSSFPVFAQVELIRTRLLCWNGYGAPTQRPPGERRPVWPSRLKAMPMSVGGYVSYVSPPERLPQPVNILPRANLRE